MCTAGRASIGSVALTKRLAGNLRHRRGALSQEAFARRLGVSRATLTRLENGSQNTTIKTLEQIAHALQCDVGDLFRPVPLTKDKA